MSLTAGAISSIGCREGDERRIGSWDGVHLASELIYTWTFSGLVEEGDVSVYLVSDTPRKDRRIRTGTPLIL